MHHSIQIQQDILNKILQLEYEIFNTIFLKKDMSLMEGVAGLAFLYSNLTLEVSNDEFTNKIETVLNAILENISSSINSVTLCYGLSGKALVLSCINQMGIYEIDIEETLQDCDNILISYFENNIQNEGLDYLHGSLGIAYYFYNIKDSNLVANRKYEFILENVLIQIDKYIQDIEGYNIISQKDFFINLGFAHGILSLILFLSKQINETKFEIKTRVEKLILILLQYETKYKNSISKFPSIVNLKNKKTDTEQYTIPLGWCYGDLITAYCLYVAGEALQDKDVIKKAQDIGLSTCKRLTKNTSKIVDACFCHGSSGVAYLYKRLYQLSGNSEFKNSYNFWIKKTIELCNFSDGIGGYKKYSGDGYENNLGILDGAMGPAIVLLDYISKKPNSTWAKVFMLD